jgi:hypothetical protein
MSATSAPYNSRIIKASALIGDTRTLLASWDFDLDADQNIERALQQNIFAKSSRSRVKNVLTAFRQRYFRDPEVGRAIAVVAREPARSQSLDRLLYFFTCQADMLLHDVVTEVIAPRQESGFEDLPVIEVQRTIERWVDEGKTTTDWNDETIERVTQGVMATLRDFGILEGRSKKSIATVTLPVDAFALIAFYLFRQAGSADRLIRHPEWQLFFLNDSLVERLLIEAHQHHYLEYHAAGSVGRLSFPAENLEAMAHVVTS